MELSKYRGRECAPSAGIERHRQRQAHVWTGARDPALGIAGESEKVLTFMPRRAPATRTQGARIALLPG